MSGNTDESTEILVWNHNVQHSRSRFIREIRDIRDRLDRIEARAVAPDGKPPIESDLRALTAEVFEASRYGTEWITLTANDPRSAQ